MKIKKAIIPVAGFGTRFLPFTKALPKAMLSVIDKPVIHYLVEEAVASGIEEIIIITGQDKKVFEDYFGRSKELEEQLAKAGQYELLEMIRRTSKIADISYVTQDRPLGLGHAIYCARQFVSKDESFAILLGDDIVYSPQKPCLAQLIEIFTEYQANVIGVQTVPNKMISHYGIIKGNNLTERLFKVEDLVEKPELQEAPSNLAIVGRYLLHSDIFSILAGTTPGKGGEIQLTDGIRILKKTQELFAYRFEGTRFDVGDKLGYLKANTELALEKDDLGKDFKKYLLDILDEDFSNPQK